MGTKSGSSATSSSSPEAPPPFELQPRLEGRLLVLRPLRPEDFDALYDAARDPRIWEQHPESNRHERAVFQKYFDGAIASGGAFAILDRKSGRMIGSSRYCNLRPEQDEAEIGWTFLERAHWGGAFNRELKTLMLDHAFRFVGRVVFVVGERNLRSQKALLKIGAKLERAVEVRDGGAAGERRVVIFALTRDGWVHGSVQHTELLRDAAERGIAYLAGVSTRRAFPDAESIARLRDLDVPLPEHPTDPHDVLRRLDEIASPATVASAGGRYFGYVIGGSHPAALASNWLASAWDQNAVFQTTSPAASALERVAFGWMLDVLRLPRDHAGGFVTGTTMAHVAALAAARHSVLERAGWDVEREGLFGAPPITVVASAEAHGTLDRAFRMLGLGTARVVRVPTDRYGRMLASKIPVVRGPAIVCAQLGHVDGGACDVLPEIVERARKSEAWVHVDGAFGLWARAAPSRAHLAVGLEDVDSCAGDLHKWLNVPYDNGVHIVRGSARTSLRAALAMSGPYFPDDDVHDPGRSTPDASRRARGVDAWAVLAALGRSGVAELIERTCNHARRFGAGLSEAGYEILNDIALNQVLVSFGSDAETQAVIRGIQSDGTCWCSGTTWRGRTAMRISVASWATTADDVERSLAAILRIAREVTSRPRESRTHE